MAEVVNLNRYRKARRNAEADKTAAENRVRYGRTKAERDREAQEKARAERELDGSRRDDT